MTDKDFIGLVRLVFNIW